MYTTHFISQFLFGVMIFFGFMPLSFYFSDSTATLLIETDLEPFIWGAQTTTLFLLIFIRSNMNSNKLIGLLILYTLVPLSFTFDKNGAYFLILNNYISSLISWSIAGVILIKLLFAQHFLTKM